MNEHDISEQAYKNGYEKGYEDGKQDAVKHGRWVEVDDGVLIGQGKHFECSECKTHTVPWRLSNFCPYRGAKMDGDGDG